LFLVQPPQLVVVVVAQAASVVTHRQAMAAQVALEQVRQSLVLRWRALVAVAVAQHLPQVAQPQLVAAQAQTQVAMAPPTQVAVAVVEDRQAPQETVGLGLSF
jgi:hypothetical protein